MRGFFRGVLLDEDEKPFRAERSACLDYPFWSFFRCVALADRFVFVEKHHDSAGDLFCDRLGKRIERRALSGHVTVEVSRSLPSFRFLFVQGVAKEKGGQGDPDRQTDPNGESSFFFADGHGKDSLPSLEQ